MTGDPSMAKETTFYDDEQAVPFKPDLKGVSTPVKTTCTNCRKVTETIVKYETTPK